MRKSLPLAAGTALVLLFFAAAVMAESGLDYVIDAGGPIDALVRHDWKEFFANQPLMGSFSLFVRAPFVMPVFHSSFATVYWPARCRASWPCSDWRSGCCGRCSATAAARPSRRWSAPR